MKIVLLIKQTDPYVEHITKLLQTPANVVDLWHGAPDDLDFVQYHLGVSFYYPHILRRRHFQAPKYGVVNVHPSYLPWGRGSYPNVWSIIGGQIPGVSIHWVDSGIDTGPIIVQKKVVIPHDFTGEQAHHLLKEEAYALLSAHWDYIQECPEGTIQESMIGARAYTVVDFERRANLDDILVSDKEHELFDKVINTIRAYTLDNFPGAYYYDPVTRQRIHVRLTLESHNNG